MKKILLGLAMVVLMATQFVEAKVKCPVGYHVDPVTLKCVIDVPPPPPPPPAGGVLCANPDGSVTYKTACSASQTPIIIPQGTEVPENDMALRSSVNSGWQYMPTTVVNDGGTYEMIFKPDGRPYNILGYDGGWPMGWYREYYYKLICISQANIDAHYPPYLGGAAVYPGIPLCE